jgi:hypothetical protein
MSACSLAIAGGDESPAQMKERICGSMYEVDEWLSRVASKKSRSLWKRGQSKSACCVGRECRWGGVASGWPSHGSCAGGSQLGWWFWCHRGDA